MAEPSNAAPPDKILVFIPCYNCAPQIVRVLAQLEGPIADRIDEVLVLDNGSKDGTAEAAIARAGSATKLRRITVARNNANYNLGGSHKSAYAYADSQGFTHVMTLHGDDQGHVDDIVPLLDAGTHRQHDACLGSRFSRGSRLQGYSLVRIVGNHVFNLLFSLAGRRWIADLGSGLNLLARKAYADPALHRLPDDLTFNAFLVLDMHARGNRVLFFPISWREDDQVSNVKMASQAMKTLQAPRLYAFAHDRFRHDDLRSVQHARYTFTPLARFVHGQRVG